MAKVRFTPNLKRFFPDLKPQEVAGTTVAEVLAAVEKTYPGFSAYIVDEQGALRKHVNIFIGNELIADKDKLSDPVAPGDEVYFLQALSGG